MNGTGWQDLENENWTMLAYNFAREFRKNVSENWWVGGPFVRGWELFRRRDRKESSAVVKSITRIFLSCALQGMEKSAINRRTVAGDNTLRNYPECKERESTAVFQISERRPNSKVADVWCTTGVRSVNAFLLEFDRWQMFECEPWLCAYGAATDWPFGRAA